MDSGLKALADVVLREAEGQLSAKPEGTVHCIQNGARTVRALYERLDRLAEAALPPRAVRGLKAGAYETLPPGPYVL